MPSRLKFSFFVAACFSPLLLVPAWAQSAPDAGALRQQIEQSRDVQLPQLAPRSTPAAPAQALTGGATVHVKSFAFQGNTRLSSAQLDAALAAFVQRDLDFAGLQAASDAVARAYREAGWLARVMLPEQDVSSGVITLQVLEAKFGGVRFEGDAPQRVLSSEIAAYFDAAQTQGQVLNTDALDRALMLADDLPGVSVVGSLVAGQGDAETELVLRTTDEPRWFGNVTADNSGSRATGASRLLVALGANSLGGRGELLSVTAMRSQGTTYGALDMTVPVGARGLRASVSLSDMRYHLVEGVGAQGDAPIRGYSNSVAWALKAPLVRARAHNLYASAALSSKGFRNQDSMLRSDYATDSLSLSLSGNRFDTWGGGGANSGSLQWRVGRLGDMQAHSQIDRIARSFHSVNYSLSRQQQLSAAHSLLVSWNAQYTGGGLDSSEKFYIGGAQSVRAYPVSELSGDRGQSLSVEWRWRVSNAWVASAFVDAGRVETLPVQAGDGILRQHLQGRGLSLSWQGTQGLSARLTWSRRNGENPQPTSTGSDGDGTLKRDRLWFSASQSF